MPRALDQVIVMRRAIVTGASDGIGKSIAIKLTKEGYKVVLFGRDKQRLAEVSACCDHAEYHAFDLNDIKLMKRTVKSVLENGDVDVLINNAGIWHTEGSLESLSEEKVIEVINTNLTSQIILTKELLPHIKNRKNSFIVNIVSKSGITAQAGQSVYSASKWGLRGFTNVLRADTIAAPLKVVGIYQSGTNTKLFEKAGDDFPVSEFTNPDDLASVITFILKQPNNLKINEIRIDR